MVIIKNRRGIKKSNKDEPMLKCSMSLCRYTSRRNHNLKRHIHNMHTDLKTPLECCGKFYPTKGEYRLHVQRRHKYQGYRCHICPKHFDRKFILKRHLKVHQGIKEFVCPAVNCNYRCNSLSNLNRHSKIHETSNIRRHSTRKVISLRNVVNSVTIVAGLTVNRHISSIPDKCLPLKKRHFFVYNERITSMTQNEPLHLTTIPKRMRLAHMIYKCYTCDLRFDNQIEMLKHNEQSHNK
ncbi:hypothetical protein CHUAL_001886 [Chamberlinius hualienensis]